ncbi:Mth938-like domain-containing protein [Actibacterium sp. 188UL27-1]|uniref:Mth938-like domain-containing protein n=1 Tax=Actibacterium sp. 188UL27-1 TaxID=2786961 RepID=UPI00195C3B3C|nr:Mth938-like domain-containing protein [Actibacterium sp. 188UL27-1]MBM7066692.1 Mth938-like domain-containing protein [Actibacterium sp. 188UL27-1]
MRLNEVSYDDAQPIEGYGPGFFRIGGAARQGPLLTSAAGPQDWAGYEDTAPLVALAGQIDVLFIGTGAEIAPLPSPLRWVLEEVDLGVEIMASPTAARTYNVLLSEGRRIAVALLPVD